MGILCIDSVNMTRLVFQNKISFVVHLVVLGGRGGGNLVKINRTVVFPHETFPESLTTIVKEKLLKHLA